jgi:hypothetical protein
MMQAAVITVTEQQWIVLQKGLGKLVMDDALPVLQALQAQINEQIAAHQMLAKGNPQA